MDRLIDARSVLHRTPEGESEPDGVARPGLFVLSGYKTAAPRLEPLLTDGVIENGRHRGEIVWPLLEFDPENPVALQGPSVPRAP